jgi:hypothetical protein
MVDRMSTPATSGASPLGSPPKLLDRAREPMLLAQYSHYRDLPIPTRVEWQVCRK